MKESYREGIANHPDPESCAGRRKAAREALTGAQAGRAWSCEINSSGAPALFRETEGHRVGDKNREPLTSPAQSETPGTPGNSMRENRDTPQASGSSTPDRLEKTTSDTTGMHARGESDERVVPAKRSHQGEQFPAESGEGSRSTKGNVEETYPRRTPGRDRGSQGLGGVREAARRDKKQKFTAWLHQVTVDLLRDSYSSLKKQAAPGVGSARSGAGGTWAEYGEGVEERLQDLHERLHRGAYRAPPSRRTYRDKDDGRKRP